MEDNPILSVADCAAELGIEPDSVRKLIARDLLRARKLGRDWYILRPDLEAYKKRRRDPGRPRR
jgi:excisionase family DNA binding protein